MPKVISQKKNAQGGLLLVENFLEELTLSAVLLKFTYARKQM
jgi:hypothetical protein